MNHNRIDTGNTAHLTRIPDPEISTIPSGIRRFLVGYREMTPSVRALAPARSSKSHPRAPPPDPRLKPGPVFVASGGVINIEALCAAPPVALAHSPSQMPLSCPVAPPSQRELRKDGDGGSGGVEKRARAARAPAGQVLRHFLWHVLHHVPYVPVLHMSPKGSSLSEVSQRRDCA